DRIGAFVGEYMAARGASVERRPDPDGRLGATVIGTWRAAEAAAGAAPRLLLIGHMDTVFDPGTAAERPFAIRDGTATGPGVTDMKSGLLAGLYAIKALIGAGPLPFERLTYVANP